MRLNKNEIGKTVRKEMRLHRKREQWDRGRKRRNDM